MTFEADGVIYAVNGTALTQIRAGRNWVTATAIQVDDPSAPEGLTWKKSVSPLIDEGLKLCADN